MRPLLKILAGGTAAFMALAIAQEWSSFEQAWFGPPAPAAVVPEVEQKAASDTVYEMLKLMEHLYASGGDPRFAERMPVSDLVREEMQADVEYLRQNQRRQEISLDRLDVVEIQPVDAERVEIRTREVWSMQVAWTAGDRAAGPAARRLVYGTYRLSRGVRGWRVDGWDPSEPWREPAPRPASGKP